MPLNARNAAFVLGVVLLIVGVLGFIPNPIISPTGFFVVNQMHNLFHIVSGIVLLLGVYSSLGPSLALKIVGVVYAIVAVLGFAMLKGGDGIMFGVAMNMMDHWLHVVLTIVILAAGFGLPRTARMAAA